MINDHLTLSDRGIALLKHLESCRRMPYDDKTGLTITDWVSGATIGYGHLIHITDWELYKNGIITRQADALLQKDLQRFEAAIRKNVIVPLKQTQFDALVIFAFNIGVSAFESSSALKMINDPRFVSYYPTLEKAWAAWKRSGGKIMPGLINRRAREWRLYSTGRYV